MKTKSNLILLAVMILAACGPKAVPTPAGTLPPIITEAPTTVSAEIPSLTPNTAPTSSVQILSGEVEIDIEDFAFKPDTATITAGTTVKWGNKDNSPHTVIGEDGSWGSNSLAKGDTFFFTFNEPGTFSYYCGFHQSMTATITVVAP